MAKTKPDFGLDPAIAQDLRDFFERQRVNRVWIFGSRARGEEHARSDVDLAVDAPSLNAAQFAALQSSLERLLLVRQVELVHWQEIGDERFRLEIETDKKVFWEPGGRFGDESADSPNVHPNVSS